MKGHLINVQFGLKTDGGCKSCVFSLGVKTETGSLDIQCIYIPTLRGKPA